MAVRRYALVVLLLGVNSETSPVSVMFEIPVKYFSHFKYQSTCTVTAEQQNITNLSQDKQQYSTNT